MITVLPPFPFKDICFTKLELYGGRMQFPSLKIHLADLKTVTLPLKVPCKLIVSFKWCCSRERCCGIHWVRHALEFPTLFQKCIFCELALSILRSMKQQSYFELMWVTHRWWAAKHSPDKLSYRKTGQGFSLSRASQKEILLIQKDLTTISLCYCSLTMSINIPLNSMEW